MQGAGWLAGGTIGGTPPSSLFVVTETQTLCFNLQTLGKVWAASRGCTQPLFINSMHFLKRSVMFFLPCFASPEQDLYVMPRFLTVLGLIGSDQT